MHYVHFLAQFVEIKTHFGLQVAHKDCDLCILINKLLRNPAADKSISARYKNAFSFPESHPKSLLKIISLISMFISIFSRTPYSHPTIHSAQYCLLKYSWFSSFPCACMPVFSCP